jgi:hypothetical protein
VVAAQQLCLAYAKTDLVAGRAHADALIDKFLDCPVPEVTRLSRTLAVWRKSSLPTLTPHGPATDPPRPSIFCSRRSTPSRNIDELAF